MHTGFRFLLSLSLAIFLMLTANTLADFQSFGAQSMPEAEAKARILKVDPEAASAEMPVMIYPSKEAYGAYAFVRTRWNQYGDASTSGNFWYITPNDAYLLGKGDYNTNWGLSTTTPEVFYNSYGKGSDRRAKACVLIQNKPVIIPDAEKLQSLRSMYSALIGYPDMHSSDYAFLKVDISDPANVQLYQIEAVELNREQFLSLDGAEDICRLLEETGGYTIHQCLYWEGSAIVLNATQNDDAPYHIYLYFDNGTLVQEGTWFGDSIGIAALSGFATPCRNLALPTLKSYF